MNQLRRQVRIARRRLAMQRFLALLPWCWFATGALAAVAIALGKRWPTPVEPWQWGVAAVAGGLLVAGLLAVVRRPDELTAALEIDRRFGLRERISSCLSLDDATLATPAGAALLADALHRLERVAVAEKFSLRLDRWTWAPLAPLAAAVAIHFLLPTFSLQPAQAAPQVAQQQQQIKKETATLNKKLQQRHEEARQRGLAEAADLFNKLEQQTKKLADSSRPDQKQTLTELNDLARQLQERRDAVGNSAAMRQQLNQLKKAPPGPAEKLAEALRKGDFEQALQEARQLREQIEKGQLDAEQKQALAEQLQRLEDKLRQMAEARREQEERLKQQIAEARAAGQNDEAERLEQQLAQLGKNPGLNEQLEQMANNLGQCAECLGEQADNVGGEGRPSDSGAQAGLEALERQLAELGQQLEEQAMLDQALAQVGECKDGMCQAGAQGQQRQQLAGGGKRPGTQPGRDRVGEKPPEAGFFDTRAGGQVRTGAGHIAGPAGGPNAPGQVAEQIKAQMAAGAAEETDPLVHQRLPRPYQDHTKDYFDALREGRR